MRNHLLTLICSVNLFLSVNAQEINLADHYIGLMPSVLVEPYDTVDAIEVNFFPFLYERRFGEENDKSFQIRPVINYRFLEGQNGFSQMGGTALFNKYFLGVFEEDFWLKPQLGVYYTYTYNRLDKIQAMTLGLEPGAFMRVSKNFTLSLNVQPGINYYPDSFSKNFVETESGFKAHFGVIFHIGFNF